MYQNRTRLNFFFVIASNRKYRLIFGLSIVSRSTGLLELDIILSPVPSKVANSHHFNADPRPDPDPSFHFNADPDPIFYFYADPDPDANLRPPGHWSTDPLGLHFARPRLYFEPLIFTLMWIRIQLFITINADPDSAS